MSDWLDSLENAAERRFEEMVQPDGRMKCGCGELFLL